MKIRMMIAVVAATLMLGCAGVQIPTQDTAPCKTMTIKVKEQIAQTISFTVPKHAPDFTKWGVPRIKPLWGMSDGLTTRATVVLDFFNEDKTACWGLAIWYEKKPVIGGETDTMQYKETAEVFILLEQSLLPLPNGKVKVLSNHYWKQNTCEETTKAEVIQDLIKRIKTAKAQRGV